MLGTLGVHANDPAVDELDLPGLFIKVPVIDKIRVLLNRNRQRVGRLEFFGVSRFRDTKFRVRIDGAHARGLQIERLLLGKMQLDDPLDCS